MKTKAGFLAKHIAVAIGFAMMLTSVSDLLAQAPSGQTRALYFNTTNGTMYLWDGKTNGSTGYTGSNPKDATTVATNTNFAGSYRWNAATRTLTLENFHFSTSHFYALYIDAQLTIELLGQSSLTSTLDVNSLDISAGLYFRPPSSPRVTNYIKGPGSLVVRSGNVGMNRSAGIRAYWDLQIESGTITAYGGRGLISNGIFAEELLSINGGVLNAHGGRTVKEQGRDESTGISAEKGLTMKEGKVYATADSATQYSSGFWSYSGPINISGGTFVSRGHRGAVYANHNVRPEGSDIHFPTDGYVVWYSADYHYNPIEEDQINSADYRQSLNHHYVKFVNFAIEDITPKMWPEGQAIVMTPPIVFSGGREVLNPHWEISEDGINGWQKWTVPSRATMDLNGKFVRYGVWMEYIENLYSNVVSLTVVPNEFSVIAGEGGTVSGTSSGRYIGGTAISVTAIPDANYLFTNWTILGITLAGGEKANPASFSMPLNTVMLRANFALKTYTVGVSASPAIGGTVTGGGRYIHGTNVTLSATPNEGYNFVEWQANGTTISTDANLSFSATSDSNFVAVFELKNYGVTVRPNNPSYGVTMIVGGGNRFDHGTKINITASTVVGSYTFVNWTEYPSGAVVSYTENFSYTVKKDVNLVANFKLDEWNFVSVAVSPENAGTVTASTYYPDGYNLTVTTTPNVGFEFVNWTIDGLAVSALPNYNFDVMEDVTIVANFVRKIYTIAVSAKPSEGGDVTGGGRFVHGTTATVSASPRTGYDFVEWTENGVRVSADASYSFLAESNRNLVANFTQKTYRVTVSTNNVDYGTVSGGGTVILHGTQITISAIPEDDYFEFVNWTDDKGRIISTPNYTFSVTESNHFTANFRFKNTYIVTVVSNPSGAGITHGNGYYFADELVTLMATPFTGYDFVSWTKNGVEVRTDFAHEFRVTENAVYVANFVRKTYTVSVSSNPSEGGAVSGNAVYSHGENATVKATANPGWSFVNWTKNGVQVSTAENYTFQAIENVDLIANFAPIIYTINVAVNDANFGEINLGDHISYTGNYRYGDEITIVATQKVDHVFVKWTDESGGIVRDKDGELATSKTYTFKVTRDVTLTANFKPVDLFFVNVVINPERAGVVAGSRPFANGERMTFRVAANQGYQLMNWTLDNAHGEEVSRTSLYSFFPDNDVTLYVNFSKNMDTITAISNPENAGVITGGGIYETGDEVVLNAAPIEGYRFVNWTKLGTQVSTLPEYKLTAVENAELIANFEKITYPIKFSVVGGSGAISATVDNVPIQYGAMVEHGAKVVFTPFPGDGFIVKEWQFIDFSGGYFTKSAFAVDYVTEPITLTVEFVHNSTTIDIEVGPGIPVIPDENDEFGFVAFARCGENSALITVTSQDENATIVINGVSGNSLTVDLPNYGDNIFTIDVTAQSGETQAYTLKINRLVPFWDMVVMRWNNTLSIVNNPQSFPALNANYFNPDSYRWFADGELFSTRQWYSAGPQSENVLNDTWEYVAQGTTLDGNVLRTCPQYISLVSFSVKAYPNPISAGETLFVEADIDESLLKGAVVHVFNIVGKHIDTINVQGRITPVNIRYSTGKHVFLLQTPTGFSQELKISVR